MIGFLKGKVIEINLNSIILLCGGVGYEININSSLSQKILLNEEFELFIYTKVREDEISLYGFPDRQYREFFKLLISVNGVGPKSAMEIMNTDIDMIKNAITQNNTIFLSKTPGIGKKTAERIIVDLKNKVVPETFTSFNDNLDEKFSDAIEALMSLGYQRSEIRRTLSAIPSEIESSEEIVTFFLRNS